MADETHEPTSQGDTEDTPDLDALLERWDQEVGDEDTPDNEADTAAETDSADTSADSSQDDPRLDALVKWAHEREAADHMRQEQEDLGALVESTKEALPGNATVTEDEIEAFFYREYRTNPAFAHAWQNRHDDPVTYRNTARSAIRQYADHVKSKPDPDATADRAAVESAVHAAASGPAPRSEPSEADIKKMSDKEFNEYVRSFGG